MIIESRGYDGKRWALSNKHLDVIEQGQTIKMKNGKTAIIQGGMAPHKPSSSGKVYTDKGIYYPQVFDLEWIMEDDYLKRWDEKFPFTVKKYADL